MSSETVLTVVGNLTADPELRYTPSGAPVASFTIASTPRTFDRTTNTRKDRVILAADRQPAVARTLRRLACPEHSRWSRATTKRFSVSDGVVASRRGPVRRSSRKRRASS